MGQPYESATLTNNDVFRRLRFCFNFSDKQVVDVFQQAEALVSKEQVGTWLKKEDEEGYASLTDVNLANFLNGFINLKRGKREGEQPKPEKKLTNNLILNKLKIALNLKAEDILTMLESVDFNLGKSELSALFRKPEHKHYRVCKDQILRNFLTALQQRHRPIQEGSKPKLSKPSNAKPKKFEKPKKEVSNKVYHNPNIAKKPKENSGKTLKLKPEDIWKE